MTRLASLSIIRTLSLCPSEGFNHIKNFLSLFTAVAVALALVWCNQSKATTINDVNRSDVFGGPNSPGISFGFTSFTQIVNGNGSTPGASANTITLNARFEAGYVQNSAFNWTIDFQDIDQISSLNGNTKYLVTMNLFNNGAVPGALARQVVTLGPPDIRFSSPVSTTAGPNSFISPSSPAPTSSIGTSFGNGFNGATPFVGFDNAGAFNVGDAATLTFTLDLADYTSAGDDSLVFGAFALSMIANPEPASFALAGFALSASGAGAFIRRKKKAVVMVDEQASAVV